MSDSAGRVTDWLRELSSGVRFGKFVSVGAVGAFCDMSTLLVLVEFAGVLEEAAVLAGIEVSILVMFVLNEHWTFPESGKQGYRATLVRFGRSHLVRTGGIAVQFVVFVVLYRLLFVSLTVGPLDLWLVGAKGSGIALGMLLNYVFESLFTWRVQHS